MNMAAATNDTRSTTKTKPTTLLRESRLLPTRNASPGGRSRPGLTMHHPGRPARSKGYRCHDSSARPTGREGCGILASLCSARQPRGSADEQRCPASRETERTERMDRASCNASAAPPGLLAGSREPSVTAATLFPAPERPRTLHSVPPATDWVRRPAEAEIDVAPSFQQSPDTGSTDVSTYQLNAIHSKRRRPLVQPAREPPCPFPTPLSRTDPPVAVSALAALDRRQTSASPP